MSRRSIECDEFTCDACGWFSDPVVADEQFLPKGWSEYVGADGPMHLCLECTR